MHPAHDNHVLDARDKPDSHRLRSAERRLGFVKVAGAFATEGDLLAWLCSCQVQHLGDYVAEWLGGRDLMIGCFAQQRLGRPQIICDALQLDG